jgi:pimeloyl-ACP methyl ester carboxylesterase
MNLILVMGMLYWGYSTVGIWGVLCLPALMLGMIYFRQNSMLYVNQAKSFLHRPSDTPFSLDYTEHTVTTADGIKIILWFCRASASASKPTIVFFHANAGTMADRLPNTKGLIDKTGANILMVEYRGYGACEGEPSEDGLKLDADAALAWAFVQDDIDQSNIFVFGRSLGGAVAIAAAAKHQSKLRGLILENTFTSIGAMASALFPFLKLLPVSLLNSMLWSHWTSEKIIGSIRLPTLFLSGLQDEIVPRIQMQELWTRHTAVDTPEHSRIHTFANGHHNDLVIKTGYYGCIARWLAAVAIQPERSTTAPRPSAHEVERIHPTKRYRVVAKAILRQSYDYLSEKIDELETGQVITVFEQRRMDDDRVRVRCNTPRGWTSLVSSGGTKLLELLSSEP